MEAPADPAPSTNRRSGQVHSRPMDRSRTRKFPPMIRPFTRAQERKRPATSQGQVLDPHPRTPLRIRPRAPSRQPGIESKARWNSPATGAGYGAHASIRSNRPDRCGGPAKAITGPRPSAASRFPRASRRVRWPPPKGCEALAPHTRRRFLSFRKAPGPWPSTHPTGLPASE